ncbi:MAG: NYN domain-containing protein [Thermodesulfobacteriota bacterium]
MALHLIIDGYNFIRQSDQLRPLDRQALELGRDALIERLAAYKRAKRHKITVVFDGSQKYYFPGDNTAEKGIKIRFSRHGESADDLIRKIAAREGERAVVVSADRAVIDYAAAQGAATVSIAEFEEKLDMAQLMEVKGGTEEDEADAGWEPGTEKKGPSKKPPKAKRKNRRKIKKL